MTRIGSCKRLRIGTSLPIGPSVVLGFLFFVAVVEGCRKAATPHKNDLTEFRKHLRTEMSYDDIVEKFGLPPQVLNEENGGTDGLSIYQYPLADSTFVRIGFTDRMVYACWVDQHHNLVEDVVVFSRENE